MNAASTIIASLENAPNIILPLVREVPEAILKRRPLPGKWSAHEHACHLAEVHPVFFTRLRLMLDEEHPTIKSYQPSRDDEDGALLKIDLNGALKRFASDRARLVAELKTLSENDWQRTAAHEEYAPYSVFIMFRHLALHDFLHAYRIEEILLNTD